jgi:hypothetical protein
MSFRSLKIAQSPNRRITEHRLKPPSVNILFNPGSQNFARSGVKKSFHGAERFGRPMLIAATVGHFRIIHPNSRHDLLRIAKFDSPHQRVALSVRSCDPIPYRRGLHRPGRDSCGAEHSGKTCARREVFSVGPKADLYAGRCRGWSPQSVTCRSMEAPRCLALPLRRVCATVADIPQCASAVRLPAKLGAA